MHGQQISKKKKIDALISQIYFWNKTLHVSDSSSVHQQEFFTVHTAMVYVLQVCCVQWKTRDDGQRNCPKHVEFYSKNKFEKLVHPVGFIIRVLDVKKNKINKNWTSHQMCCSTSDVMCCSTLLPFSSKALWLSSFIGLSFFGLIIIPILMSLYRLKLVLFSVCLFFIFVLMTIELRHAVLLLALQVGACGP